MESNKFELTGRVNYKDVSTSKGGMSVTKLLLSKRLTRGESVEYQSYNITLFGDEATKAAKINKSDLIHVTGHLSTSKYEKDGKQMERMQLIADSFDYIEYDEDKKQYIVICPKKQDDEDEIPW